MIRKMNTYNELYITWKHIYKLCYSKSSPKYQGIPCQWNNFDDFYKDNIARYRRAKKKWRHISKTNTGADYKLRQTKFVRKIASKGFIKANTVFTSCSDASKYAKSTYLIMIDNKQLGTRDIQKILKKQGVEINQGAISYRVSHGKDVFDINRLNKFYHKGKYKSTIAIAENEGISHGLFTNKIYAGFSVKDAVEYCKNFKRTKYKFEGKILRPFEIANILYERVGINPNTTLTRISKWGYDESKLKQVKSNSPYAPYPKAVIAEKDGNKLEFKSITECCKTLGIKSTGDASKYARGKRVGLLKGYKITMKQMIAEQQIKSN